MAKKNATSDAQGAASVPTKNKETSQPADINLSTSPDHNEESKSLKRGDLEFNEDKSKVEFVENPEGKVNLAEVPTTKETTMAEMTEEQFMSALTKLAAGEQINKSDDQAKEEKEKELISDAVSALAGEGERNHPMKEFLEKEPSDLAKKLQVEGINVHSVNSAKANALEQNAAKRPSLKEIEFSSVNEEDLIKKKKFIASEVLARIQDGNFKLLEMPHQWLVHVLNFPDVIYDPDDKTIIFRGKVVNVVPTESVEDYVLSE